MSLRDRVYGAITYANVVRFGETGYWPGRGRHRASFVADEVEVVRTDRYLSADATSVLAVVPLRRPRH